MIRSAPRGATDHERGEAPCESSMPVNNSGRSRMVFASLRAGPSAGSRVSAAAANILRSTGDCILWREADMRAADEGLRNPDASPSVERQARYGIGRELRAICAMRPRQIVSLLSQAYTDWASDGAARLGAALAYFTLFSVAPVLVVVTGVVGLFIGQAAAKGEVAPWLERLLSPQGAQAAELMLKQAATPAGGVVTTLARSVQKPDRRGTEYLFGQNRALQGSRTL
jgi:hypothetical protein